MFERFTQSARSVVVEAQDQARRFGHPRLDCEHLLLAICASGTPAADALAGLGITPATIEATLPQPHTGRPFEGIDGDALAAIGIDLERVRASVEKFLQPASGGLGGDATGRSTVRRRRRTRIHFSANAKHCLERSLRESSMARDGYLGVEHILLALTVVDSSIIGRVLASAGTDREAVRAAVREQYRRAG
jgi:ATP-dependent Clp protease ATP-binding subunit ClpA